MKIQDYGILVAIVTAIITGSRFLYTKFKESQLKYRNKLNGNWINEGSIGGEPETHYIHLSLTVDSEDGEITGILQSRNLSNEDNIRLGVNGKIRYKSAFLEFTKVNQGRVSNLGKAKIVFTNTKILDWHLINDYNDFFPTKTQVWRTDFDLSEA